MKPLAEIMDKKFLKKAVEKKVLPQDSTVDDLTDELKEEMWNIVEEENSLKLAKQLKLVPIGATLQDLTDEIREKSDSIFQNSPEVRNNFDYLNEAIKIGFLPKDSTLDDINDDIIQILIKAREYYTQYYD